MNEVDKMDRVRHSLAHILAWAVKELYGDVKFGIGPVIEGGFYYDLDLEHRIVPEDLKAIEAKMIELLKRDVPFEEKALSADEARVFFKEDPYKMELIEELAGRGETITVYTCGDFADLCRGPHVTTTKEIPVKAFQLASIAGSYWRGDEKRPMLQRIYGWSFANPKELREHIHLREEMKKRDHRLIGKEMDLFSVHEEAGPGLIYWHPAAARMRVAIEDFWRREHYKNGYEIVFTPHVGRSWLWETSGHLDFYADGMYAPMEIDKSDYYIKPMNCPFHIMIYNNSLRSYRELPFRWAELGTVYRYERLGTVHGMLRARGFTQDDAHIICTPDQIEAEILEVLRFSLFMLRSFGFTEIAAYLSTRPEKAVGEESRWETAQESLRKAIEAEGLPFEVDEGGGAFYGPKIDLKVKDAMKREWQLSTIQFDFNLPERFDMSFVDADGVQKRPYMVHRALLGSLERFFGVLVEHYGGLFPLWLAPVQIAVVPVREEHNEAATKVVDALREEEMRVELFDRSEHMNNKIKKARKEKIPYTIVIGDKEASSDVISVRTRSNKIINDVPFKDFQKSCLLMVKDKCINIAEEF